MLKEAPSWPASGHLPRPILVGVVAGFLFMLLHGSMVCALIAGAAAAAALVLVESLGNAPAGSGAVVIWFTGLSGSGKSTIGGRVVTVLRSRGHRVEHLDGDAIRAVFPATGFSRKDRDDHIRRVGYLASRLQAHGITVVATFVSPYREAREFVRGLCGRFVEVHVSTPLAECERRDVKGLYTRARKGELEQFTGVDDPYEPPLAGELTIDTTVVSVDEACARVVRAAGLRDREH